MRDVENDYHPKALDEVGKLADSPLAEVRGLVRTLLRRRRRVIASGNMDAEAIPHPLPDGRVMYHFEQGGRAGGLVAFLYIKDNIFYLLSVAGYEGRWDVSASEKAYFDALAAAVRRIDDI